MSEAPQVDRRKSPRYRARLNLNVHVDLGRDPDRLQDLETINVSSSGLYFFSAAWIEPMTKLALSFDVPVDREDPSRTERVECEGIVVRSVPEVPDPEAEGYEVAVFFTTIDADSLLHLESYLDTVLSA
jgi:hypothetical protein